MRTDDPNFPILLGVAEALGELRDEIVFVGGCAAGMLITDAVAHGVRPTYDVDAIVEATTIARFHAVEKRLPAHGFIRDMQSDVICRWKHSATGTSFDLMPTDPGVLGFSNRWYAEAMRTSMEVALTDAIRIRLVSAPAFIATKFEAFATRGKLDVFSHDLEDIIVVVDGRAELAQELRFASAELQVAVRAQVAALLLRRDFDNAIPGMIADHNRLDTVLQRLRDIAA